MVGNDQFDSIIYSNLIENLEYNTESQNVLRHIGLINVSSKLCTKEYKLPYRGEFYPIQSN